MESSKEKIEAQLCAYVDGELDDAQRAEIEQHLAANPQHKSLIAELRAASGLLRDLPRVAAPIEVNESLCGQLERSALLNPSDDDYARPARQVSRWPQVSAVAAVLLLAVGLGVVVYYVLPPAGNHGPGPLAMDDKSAATHPLDNDSDGVTLGRKNGPQPDSYAYGVNPARPDPDAGHIEPHRDDYFAAGRRPAGGTLMAPPAATPLDAGRAVVTGKDVVSAAEVENVRRLMNDSLGMDNAATLNLASGSSLYLLVSTNNTNQANQQLAAYFKGNGIQYMADDAAATTVAGEPAARDESAASKFGAIADADQDKDRFASRSAGGRAYGGSGALAAGVEGRDARGVRVSPAPDAGGAKSETEVRNVQEGLVKGKDVNDHEASADSTKGGFGGAGGGGAAPTELAQRTRRGDLARAPSTRPDDALAEAKNAPAKSETTQFARQDSLSAANGVAKSLGDEKTTETLRRSLATAADRQGGQTPARPTTEPVLRERALAQLNDPVRLQTQRPAWEFRLTDGARMAKRYADETGATAGVSRVIIARMNRRQANDLSAALSREQGQRAELKEFAAAAATPAIAERAKASDAAAAVTVDPGALTLGAPAPAAAPAQTAGKPAVTLSPATDAPVPTAIAAITSTPRPAAKKAEEGEVPVTGGLANAGNTPAGAAAAAKPQSNPSPENRGLSSLGTTPADTALRLKADPLDEPVDVYIVVKSDTVLTPAPAATSTPAESKPEADQKK